MVLFINGCPGKESGTKRLADALDDYMKILSEAIHGIKIS